jgi:pyruvate,orthophosphate dikinase
MQAPGNRALDVNLARTAVDVVIPPGHLALLEIAAPWVGVRQAAAEILREVHHRYPGWAQALADLHRRAMGDHAYYARSERGVEALAILSELYEKIAAEATSPTIRQEAVRCWLAFLERVATGSVSPEQAEAVLDAALIRVAALVDGEAELAVQASPHLRALVRVFPAGADALRASLRVVYASWLARPDAATRFRERVADGGAPPAALARIDHRALHAFADALDAPDGLLALPDNAEILKGYLAVAGAIAAPDDRVRWLIDLLGRPELEAVHVRALRDVSHAGTELLRDPAGDGAAQLVRTVFAVVREGSFGSPQTVFDLIARIGCDVLATRDPDLARLLVAEMLSVPFRYPNFAGYTEEWSVRVDPAHLANVRAWLRVIEADPTACRSLIVALFVHLREGGAFFADTDLFQRDVSGLLAAEIGPVYLEIRHLLRLLPVYFNEIGAEGDLRDASTRLDELEQRSDVLCHFLRKQSHVECNPRLVAFADDVARFWESGDAEPLRAYLPPDLYARLPALAGRYARLRPLVSDVEAMANLPPAELHARLSLVDGVCEEDREKVELLFRVRREIVRKYGLDHLDVVERLRAYGKVDHQAVADLETALAAGDEARALETSLDILEALKRLVLSREPTVIHEDIYRKRHIASGIPSMYGSYSEQRFEALGLSFRLESLATALLERVIADDVPTDELDRAFLRRVAAWLRLLVRALRVGGYRAQGVAHCLDMLDEAVETPGIGAGELLNVFQLLSRNVESLVRARSIDPFGAVAERLLEGMLDRGVVAAAPGESRREAVLHKSEVLLRDLIAGSFGLQRIDLLAGRVLRGLGEIVGRTPPPETPHAAPDGDVAALVVPLTSAPGARRGIVSLGNKGYMLSRLQQFGFPVPAGFVLTTRLVGGWPALRGGSTAYAAVEREIVRQVAAIEERTGLRYGDPTHPLLLSVRSGAPISMPGVLTSFLNVGINVAVAEGLAARSGEGWAAWDALRRFVQSWGMSRGLERGVFDRLMRDAKRVAGVEKKAQLAPHEMRGLALAYRDVVLARGIELPEEPLPQLVACIEGVRASWDSPQASEYRRELQIAEGWSTAIVVQQMVFGNLNARSGTGVILTSHPVHGTGAVELYGDWAAQAQGDDVVGGVVETSPISERQRRAAGPGAPRSLEHAFPAVYAELDRFARQLVEDRGLNHQEVEFTFEGDRPEDLWILQARDAVLASTSVLSAFVPDAHLERSWLGTGVGVSGGALSGRAAHRADEIADLRRAYPDEPVILLRRDTVPDDIPLVLRVDGLLTAVGGATSHAAVAAKRLGKTCVVSCRSLQVDEERGRSLIGSVAIATGDAISISGLDGSVYSGAHAATDVHVHGRAQQ